MTLAPSIGDAALLAVLQAAAGDGMKRNVVQQAQRGLRG